MLPRGDLKKQNDIEKILTKQKKDGYPYKAQMADTVWISIIDYEHCIANKLLNIVCSNMKNPSFLKNSVKLSVSSIQDVKQEAEESCERVMNYVYSKVFEKASIKIEKD